jgi:hypothetical protein
MFIPKRAVYLSSSIGHYDPRVLVRVNFVASPFASGTTSNLTRGNSGPRTV